ncbi:hypothetical protein C1H46_017295 [Malus baccata]|uniref:Uncharacterized protein n=1 Tax=Malus baccata TaxID=106549 RepID=A0A540MEP0_MALBA|nr:hypothetical protein C1H46_017295 [Malus baccata]
MHTQQAEHIAFLEPSLPRSLRLSLGLSVSFSPSIWSLRSSSIMLGHLTSVSLESRISISIWILPSVSPSFFFSLSLSNSIILRFSPYLFSATPPSTITTSPHLFSATPPSCLGPFYGLSTPWGM